MAALRPLPSLLSQALVAFTIELDNEWERQMPHRTTMLGGRGPWALSLRQYSNYLRCVPPDGITAPELARAVRVPAVRIDGMRRWSYVRVESGLIRPTRWGARAALVWVALLDVVERRWRERLGADRVDALRDTLGELLPAMPAALPDWLSCTYGGSVSAPVDQPPELDRRRPLSALLSIPLHAFALDYEREAIVSLMYGANVLAVLGAGAVTVAQLPRRCGVAIEALRPALRILGERGLVSVAGRRAALTEAGAGALTDHEAIIASIEATWRAGGRPVDRLRSALEAILAPDAPLWPALEPPPESWRSSVPRPELLPAFPMPRQGGHPDGA